MKISKVANTSARRIFRLCLKDGRLDEENLMTCVRKIAATKPRGYRAILHAIKRLVRLELNRRQVTIESATELDDTTREQVASGLTAKYGSGLKFDYRVTPELLGGLKVRVGDDVFDGSVKGRLNRLQEAF